MSEKGLKEMEAEGESKWAPSCKRHSELLKTPELQCPAKATPVDVTSARCVPDTHQSPAPELGRQSACAIQAPPCPDRPL